LTFRLPPSHTRSSPAADEDPRPRKLPGTDVLGVDVGVSTDARVRYDDAQKRICAAVLEAAPDLPVGKAVTLKVDNIPFPVGLFRRSKDSVSDFEASRLDRVRRALADKCPKLLAARTDGRLSILALESNDRALANFNVVGLTPHLRLQSPTYWGGEEPT
jgi:hypothetical protein